MTGLPGVATGVAVQGLVGYTLQHGATIRAFAGLRDDAFFFDLVGFRTVTGATAPMGRLIQRDAGGAIVMAGSPPHPVLNFVNDRDFFQGQNTPAIVVEFPLLAVSPTNQVFRVWASTARTTAP